MPSLLCLKKREKRISLGLTTGFGTRNTSASPLPPLEEGGGREKERIPYHPDLRGKDGKEFLDFTGRSLL